MTTFQGPRGIDVDVCEATGTADVDADVPDLEPEELRMLAKACTQAAQHIEAARR